LKIYKSKTEYQQLANPGTIITDGKTFLKFATADGYIDVLDLQMEGKKRMLVTDFLRGYRLKGF
jgi:methionyl-tRNA formyltransferase